MPIFILAVFVTLFVIWAGVDKVVFRGFASVRIDANAKPAAKGKAIAVQPPPHLRCGASVVRGTVSAAKAEQIAWTPDAKRMVVLRRRLFGKLRVTYVS